jgi:uncharacterized protein
MGSIELYGFDRVVFIYLRKEALMPKFVLTGTYCENVLEKRSPFREAHLTGLQRQHADGVLVTLGPTQDLTQVFGIYDAPDVETVTQLVEADPYWQNGIWTSYVVKEWIQAIGG